MNEFRLTYSLAAENDIERLSDVIIYQYESPLTAFRYMQGLLSVIADLKKNASIYPIQTDEILQLKYGSFVRRVNFKKMTVIYTIHDKTVYIHRVVPQSAI